jgi:leucyl/phenylalanyl-tRNA---protein transferase
MTNYNVPGIISGYAKGHFLMAEDDDDLQWYSSRERALIPLDDRFRYPKSLQRVLNQQRFQVGIDRAFVEVVNGCANRATTWISSELKDIYLALHQTGWAHSFETWDGDTLAGGILGITIGGAFVGESMFFNISDSSKVAMVQLVRHLRNQGFTLFDAQMLNPHLERFGAYTIEGKDYHDLLKTAVKLNCRFN